MRIEIIDKYLQDGYINEAKQGLYEMYSAQDRQEFEADLRAEYDELFPSTRDMNDEEYKEWFTENVLADEKEDYLPKVEIDYSEDENYVTFEQYKNETRVVSEATYVCDECQLALDNELCINNEEHTTRLIPEVTELVRPYIAKDVTDRINEYLKSKYAELRAKAYPPMEMFADAWVKNDTEAMEEYRRLCLEVKERFPK